MKRVHVICEGQTEEEFVREIWINDDPNTSPGKRILRLHMIENCLRGPDRLQCTNTTNVQSCEFATNVQIPT